MKAKQLNAQSYGVTSSTARRILQSLEKMSSPLAVKVWNHNELWQNLNLVKSLNFVVNIFCYCNVNRMQKEFRLLFLLPWILYVLLNLTWYDSLLFHFPTYFNTISFSFQPLDRSGIDSTVFQAKKEKVSYVKCQQFCCVKGTCLKKGLFLLWAL